MNKTNAEAASKPALSPDVQLAPAPRPVTESRQNVLARVTGWLVYAFERLMPDPYVFAIVLTGVAAAMAFFLAPNGSVRGIATGWYAGLFNILSFAFEMVMMLVMGYALASAPSIHRALSSLASVPNSPAAAVSLTVAVSMLASWLNWGLGLVVAALLAREIAKRLPIDFGWLVAAAYSGFVISTEGLSGSIALSQATHGSVLNIVEKVTGQILPLRVTVFTTFNLVPVIILFTTLPFVFRYLSPSAEKTLAADPARLNAEDQEKAGTEQRDTIGARLDGAWPLTLLLVALGALALVFQWWHDKISLNLNSVILILLLLGLLLHWTPKAYVNAIKKAARITGPLVLQYPLYGGLMGIMTGTGLALVISKAFLRFATARTFPLWTYLTSLVITLFVPSGGGHWAVQGPFAVPAAVQLKASLARTTMAVAMGESVANMLQPFWALPILVIAGIPMRRMMGYMVVTFVISLIVFATFLLF